MSQDALERAQRSFNLDTPPGRAAFLAAQRDAVTALAKAAPELQSLLEASQDRLARDLAELGHDAGERTFPTPRADDTLGRGYVWHSQQLALRITARRLPEDAAEGTRFLRAPRDAAAWRALCDELENLPGYGPEGDHALTAANDWLALFETIHLEHARTR